MNLAKSSQDFEDFTTIEIVTWALENPNTKECGLHVNAATKV